MRFLDFRSDTVTQPSGAMKQAMIEAPLGDDVYGEDPTVNRLEAMGADLLGMEAGLFTPSGTQANLVALMSHCERGDEYIVGQHAHTYKYEGGGAAVLGSIQPQPLPINDDGTISLDEIDRFIKPDNYHFAVTKLLALENTQWGRVLPLPYLQDARQLCLDRGIAMHLDGARLFNAAVAQSVPAQEIASCFDSVSICISKGLGAPAGSLLCGTAPFIKKARRWRKVLGGGMRQAGMLAAAAIYALENNVSRLAHDHENAMVLAAKLRGLPGVTVKEAWLQSNMVFVEMEPQVASALAVWLEERDVLIHPGSLVRLVTHLDLSREDVLRAADLVSSFFTEGLHEKAVTVTAPNYFK